MMVDHATDAAACKEAAIDFIKHEVLYQDKAAQIIVENVYSLQFQANRMEQFETRVLHITGWNGVGKGLCRVCVCVCVVCARVTLYVCMCVCVCMCVHMYVVLSRQNEFRSSASYVARC